MRIILFCAVLAVIVGCTPTLDETRVRLFPEPFGVVHLGMSETDFTNVWTKAAFDTNSVDGAWWEVGEVGQFEDSGFRFTSVGGRPDRTLSASVLHYRPGTSYRAVLADAESRLGPAPSCKTALFCGALCFQRTWRFGWGEATLFFSPLDADWGLRWRIERTGPSSLRDNFALSLPDDVVKEVGVGFFIPKNGSLDLNPAGVLSLEATRSLFGALTGWEAFDPVDLESRILRGKEGSVAMRGYWFVEGWHFALGEDASWVVNLGSDEVARAIPESRRPVIIGAFASLTNATAATPD